MPATASTRALPRQRSASSPFIAAAPAEEYDLVIVGSDEVWNLRHPWYAGYELFYGKGLRARRLASYAASFGNHDASNGLDGHWAQRLRVFSSISVRDENSRRLVSQVLESEPPLVLDPCLQFANSIPDASRTRAPYAARPRPPVFGSGERGWPSVWRAAVAAACL